MQSKTSSLRSTISPSNAVVGPLERDHVDAALTASWISGMGSHISRFDHSLARQIDLAHFIATGNSTLAIEPALRALEVGRRDEIIVPALNFTAPAMSVLDEDATRVLADIAPTMWTECRDDVVATTSASRYR